MIVTVNPNTAIDRTIFVPSFALSRTIRATSFAIGMGGKAADASYILGELGIPSLALGFAAGRTGEQMEVMLHSKGVSTDFIWTAGETRLNILIVSEDGSGQSTLANESLLVSQNDVDLLYEKYLATLSFASCIVLGGSLPEGMHEGIYTVMIQEAQKRDIPVIFDASGRALQAGLEGHPSIVKPNQFELGELAGEQIASTKDAFRVACKIQNMYGVSLIVTLGGQGALAVLPNCSYFIPPLEVKIVSTAGAGDGVLAGLAASLSQHKTWEDGLRLGFAAAAAVMMTPATADCHRHDVENLLDRVTLLPYPTNEG
jgi:1-phosphofructokinase family hexose kinase